MKAIAYIRVSTDDQSNSVITQQSNIEAYCKFKGITIEKIFIDENVSGFLAIGQRPKGSEMLKYLAITGIKDVISVKHDRLFRNTVDALTTIASWNDNNINLHLSNVGGTSVETSTAIGRMLFTQIVSFAEFERNMASERTKTVLLNKKDTGKVYSPNVLGFENINGELIVNEKEMEAIRFIFNNKNLPLLKIARLLNENGHKTKKNGKFHASTIKYILENKVYTKHVN